MEVVEAKVDAKNQLWFKQQGDKVFIGFTETFLEIVRDCWHITPSNLEDVKVNQPLMTIETNEELFTVSSPASGHIVDFSNVAQNFPDQLKADTVVCALVPNKPKKAAIEVDWPTTTAEFIITAQPPQEAPIMPRNMFSRDVAVNLHQRELREAQAAESILRREHQERAVNTLLGGWRNQGYNAYAEPAPAVNVEALDRILNPANTTRGPR